VGLTNLGATCYVNTFLQVWFLNLELRQALYLCPSTCSDYMMRDGVQEEKGWWGWVEERSPWVYCQLDHFWPSPKEEIQHLLHSKQEALSSSPSSARVKKDLVPCLECYCFIFRDFLFFFLSFFFSDRFSICNQGFPWTWYVAQVGLNYQFYCITFLQCWDYSPAVPDWEFLFELGLS
jgi:hypothetical protein